MKLFNLKATALCAALTAAIATPAHAAIIISEVSPWSSGDSTYAADWFELTNTGTSAVNISGWKVDDGSNAFGSSLALRGVTSIGAGQSAIFLESTASASSSDTTIDNAFKTAWFGANVPAGFLIGNYGGSGIGLSTSGDAVNIFNAGGTLITRVDFAASTSGRTFDNSGGLNNVTISTLSSVGVYNAFKSANGAEIGSPGQVPVPAALPLLMSGLGLLGGIRLRRRKA